MPHVIFWLVRTLDLTGFDKNRHTDRFVTTGAPRIQVQWRVNLVCKFSDLSAPTLQVQWLPVLFTLKNTWQRQLGCASCWLSSHSRGHVTSDPWRVRVQERCHIWWSRPFCIHERIYREWSGDKPYLGILQSELALLTLVFFNYMPNSIWNNLL
jgi:hypothetical protein